MPKRRKQEKAQNRAQEEGPADAAGEAEVEDQLGTSPQKARRKRGWLVRGASLLGFIVVLVLLAPTVLTRTPVRNYLLARLLPAEVATVSIGSLQCGWWTPVRVSELQAHDAEGRLMLEVASIDVDRTLLQLITDLENFGKIVVNSPKLYALLRTDGSNLEDAIAPWLVGPAEPSDDSATVAVSLVIVDGEIVATQQDNGTTWQITGLQIDATLPSSVAEPCRVNASGKLDGQPFAVAADVPIQPNASGWPLGDQGSCSVTADAVSLQPLRYLARRAGQAVDVAGALTAELQFRWQQDNLANAKFPAIEATVAASTTNLQFAATELLGRDTLSLPEAALDVELSAASGLLSLQTCRVDSSLGQASLTGSAALADLSGADVVQGILSTLRTQAITLQGHVDVAALTQTLPTVLHIQEDTQLTSGQLAWDIKNRVVPGSPTKWEGWARTQHVAVTKGGRPISWQFPLQVEFSVMDGEIVSAENVAIESDFFDLHAQGTLADGSLRGTADLQRLLTQLAQVIDLDGLDVRGGWQGELSWRLDERNQLGANATMQLSQFELVRQGQLMAREPSLTVTAQAVGQVTARTLDALESARFDVVAGSDILAAELLEPVSQPHSGSTWQLGASLRGEVANWQARLRTFGVELGYELGGRINAQSQIAVSPARTTVKSLQGNVSNLTVVGEGIRVNEPIVRFSTTGTIVHETLTANFPDLMFASSSISLAGKHIAIDSQPTFAAAGDLGFRADLARLMRFIETSPGAPTYEGSAVGTLRLAATESKTRFRLSCDVDQFVMSQSATQEAPAVVLWREPKVTINCEGDYDAARDHLAIPLGELTSNPLTLRAKGTLDNVTGIPLADLQGTVAYDLPSLLQAATPYVGSEIRLSGRHQERFLLKGPLVSSGDEQTDRVAEELTAQFGLAWDAADIYSVPLGAGRVDLTLLQGVLRSTPIHLTVDQGQVVVNPMVYLNSPDLWMTLEPGVIAESVQITPEMCKSWLRFVAPLMADATSAQGTFSVSLSKAEIPLLQPMAGRVEGQLAIHGGALGPGPMTQQLLGVAQQVKQLAGRGSGSIVDPRAAWIELSPQQILFQMQDGRVYHEGFRMIVDGVPIQTRGFVGQDESLQLQAQLPIMDDWIDGEPALAGLRGQVVTIPISGTISRPQLDQRGLTQLSSQLVGQAARGYLEREVGNQLQKQLQKLFQ